MRSHVLHFYLILTDLNFIFMDNLKSGNLHQFEILVLVFERHLWVIFSYEIIHIILHVSFEDDIWKRPQNDNMIQHNICACY